MKVEAELSIVPVGVGVSTSGYIAVCERILDEAGLKHDLNAGGTNIEGEWGRVCGALERCLDELHRMGVPRVFTVLKIDSRTDRDQTMEERVRSVEAKLRSGETRRA